MKLYAKIVNETTKQVNVGIGKNDKLYKKMGFVLCDVELGYDNNYYLQGFAPKQDEDEVRNLKLAKLKREVEQYFYKHYPVYKQNNIAIFGTEKEKLEFKEFHDRVVAEYDEKVKAVSNNK